MGKDLFHGKNPQKHIVLQILHDLRNAPSLFFFSTVLVTTNHSIFSSYNLWSYQMGFIEPRVLVSQISIVTFYFSPYHFSLLPMGGGI